MYIKIPPPSSFWLWLCRFAYKRLKPRNRLSKEPTGIPGRRDPDSLCDAYSPRDQNDGEWNGCQTDGHYLCKECALIDEDKLQEYK
jgi:hypothetical protein